MNQDIESSQASSQRNPLPMVQDMIFSTVTNIIALFLSFIKNPVILFILFFALLLLSQVTVETLEKGFLINVFVDKSCPGLLVFILEAFEELDLNVQEARVSCTDSFRLQAVGGEVGDEFSFFFFLSYLLFFL